MPTGLEGKPPLSSCLLTSGQQRRRSRPPITGVTFAGVEPDVLSGLGGGSGRGRQHPTQPLENGADGVPRLPELETAAAAAAAAAREGARLFGDFVAYEIGERQQPADAEIEPVVDMQLAHLAREAVAGTIAVLDEADTRREQWRQVGWTLRNLAEEFRFSRERQRVRLQARMISVHQITAADFHALLTELFFRGGVTRERVVILFFFCSDVAIRGLVECGVNWFRRLVAWSLAFVRHRVAGWVTLQGGWLAAMQRDTPHVVRSIAVGIAASLMGLAACRVLRSLFN